MTELRVNFVDFWPGFKKGNNYFYHLLSLDYRVVIDEDDPELLFFSVDYAKTRERYRFATHPCKKIFYTGENVRPNFDGPQSIDSAMYSIGKCDFAFTFDFSADPRNYRLPLWVLHIDWFNKGGYVNPKYLLPYEWLETNPFIQGPHDKFCVTIFSNPVPMRVDFFHKLSTYKAVDGWGKPFGNWSDGEDHKYQILSNYKFSICFENSINPNGGYYTEKLFHAKTAGTIPIYWSESDCAKDFNPKAFLNLNNFVSMDDLINKIIEIDNNETLYNSYLNEPLFPESKFNPSFYPSSVLTFFKKNIII